MASCILTTFNYQIDQKLITEHQKVMNKMTEGTDIQFIPLRYNLPRKMLLHYQTLDYGLKNLIGSFDNFLILDVDCIPLNKDALVYTFERIKQNVLIGTAQRSMHIENNKHVYCGSPCVGFSKELFYRLGSPSFIPTERGDTAEELTYRAEEIGNEIEIFMPSKYEAEPFGGPAWELHSAEVKYGVGTTFIDKNGDEMYYHLFESRRHVHNQLFFNKCKEVLNEST